MGVESFGDNSSIYRVRGGHWHLIDSEHIRHICNRHGDAAAERSRGHQAITIDDFDRVPELVDARNICEFSVEGGMPRIKCRRQFAERTLVLVQEIRTREGVIVKTMYREK